MTKVPVADVLKHLPAGTPTSLLRSGKRSCGTVGPARSCAASGDRLA